MKMNLVFVFLLAFTLSGCLVTRQEVRDSVKSEPLTAEQQKNASQVVKAQELDEQMRLLIGRVETLENQIHVVNSEKNNAQVEHLNEKRALEEKLKIYEEAITKLEGQVAALAAGSRASSQASAQRTESRSQEGKSTYDVAEGEYRNKRWKEAIVAFEKYRSNNPTGKRYAESTYKIGASFHELTLKTEARAFYEEVVQKFPNSDWAQKAKQRLRALK